MQGLGKTIQTIAFFAHLLEENDLGPHLIICPSSTIGLYLQLGVLTIYPFHLYSLFGPVQFYGVLK